MARHGDLLDELTLGRPSWKRVDQLGGGAVSENVCFTLSGVGLPNRGRREPVGVRVEGHGGLQQVGNLHFVFQDDNEERDIVNIGI